MGPLVDHREAGHAVFGAAPGSWPLALAMLQLRVCLRSYEELLPGRPLDVGMERIGPEHAGE
jgi:hypothetical protein